MMWSSSVVRHARVDKVPDTCTVAVLILTMTLGHPLELGGQWDEKVVGLSTNLTHTETQEVAES